MVSIVPFWIRSLLARYSNQFNNLTLILYIENFNLLHYIFHIALSHKLLTSHVFPRSTPQRQGLGWAGPQSWILQLCLAQCFTFSPFSLLAYLYPMHVMAFISRIITCQLIHLLPPRGLRYCCGANEQVSSLHQKRRLAWMTVQW
jgi:hypothetical protein